LESGGLEPDTETQGLYGGSSVGQSYFGLDGSRARYFGGSSNCWRGVCRPLDAIDFAQREEIPDSGWPFDLDELGPYYERAQGYLDLGPFAYDSSRWQPLQRGTLRLDPARIRTGVMQLSETRFSGKFVDQIRQSEEVDTLLYANAREIVISENGSRVVRVEVATLSGAHFTVSAKWFVLATGGIENARVLLASNSVRTAGVGNENDLVGRYFMEHPHLVTPRAVLPTTAATSVQFYTWREIEGTWLKGYLAPTATVLREEKLPNSVAQLVNPREPRDSLTRSLFEVAREMDRGAERQPILLDVLSISEQTPNAESRVSLERERDAIGMPRAQLDWRLNRADIEGFKRTHELIGRELGRAGVGRMRGVPPYGDDTDAPRSETWRGRRELQGSLRRESVHRGEQRVSHIGGGEPVSDDRCARGSARRSLEGEDGMNERRTTADARKPSSRSLRHDEMPRRDALCVIGSAGLALSAPGLLAWLGGCGRHDTDSPQGLRTFFASASSARIVGKTYLELRPEEADADRLLALIAHEDPATRSDLQSFDAASFRRFILQQHLQDFEQHRIVNLWGWLLSETEVRLCALSALSASGRGG
jgi:hypothetical protein